MIHKWEEYKFLFGYLHKNKSGEVIVRDENQPNKDLVVIHSRTGGRVYLDLQEDKRGREELINAG